MGAQCGAGATTSAGCADSRARAGSVALPVLPDGATDDASNAQTQRCSCIASELDLRRKFNAEKRTAAGGSPGCRCPTVGYTCRKGCKPRCLYPNQDSWGVHSVPGKATVVGVFDGHGERGHLVSDFANATLAKAILEDSRCGTEDTPELLKEAFHRVHQVACGNKLLGAEHSGTTATVVLHEHQKARLSVAHVGDSTAVLLKRPETDKEGGLRATVLTRDHKPHLEDERFRIEASGGRVFSDGYNHRVGRRSNLQPGLAMSRSLGDGMAHRCCGVSAEAEVTQYDLQAEDHALLVCSDGIWEVVTPQEAADILAGFEPWQCMEAARKLADVALKRWVDGTGGVVVDDITVVYALLHPKREPLKRSDTASTAASSTGAPPAACPAASAGAGAPSLPRQSSSGSDLTSLCSPSESGSDAA